MLKPTAVLAAFIGFAVPAVFAQSVISAHSGLIHYVEGRVLVGDKPAETKYGVFPEVKVNEVLRAEDGRAEVILTPGVFLRLAENSSVRMLSNKLNDTRVEILSGVIMLECGELLKDNAITLLYKDRQIAVEKAGLFRLDADKAILRVYEGEAVVNTADGAFTVKKAKSVELNAAVLTAEKFDAKTGDDFYRWASRRAGYLSMANVAAAKSFKDSGASINSGQWAWNQWFGMFTYIPYRGIYNSPFGYSFWSPYTVYSFIRPNYGYYNSGGNYGGGGYNTGGARYDSEVGYNVGTRSAGMTASSPGYSGSPMSSGGAVASAPVAVSGGSRGADAGGASRGSSSGGGRH